MESPTISTTFQWRNEDLTVTQNSSEHSTAGRKSAGHVIVDSLVAHGVERAYVVPGESYLDVLDGLYKSPSTP